MLIFTQIVRFDLVLPASPLLGKTKKNLGSRSTAEYDS
jgi:hypothetical protein